MLSFFILALPEEAKNIHEEDEHFKVQATGSAFYYQRQSVLPRPLANIRYGPRASEASKRLWLNF